MNSTSSTFYKNTIRTRHIMEQRKLRYIRQETDAHKYQNTYPITPFCGLSPCLHVFFLSLGPCATSSPSCSHLVSFLHIPQRIQSLFMYDEAVMISPLNTSSSPYYEVARGCKDFALQACGSKIKCLEWLIRKSSQVTKGYLSELFRRNSWSCIYCTMVN